MPGLPPLPPPRRGPSVMVMRAVYGVILLGILVALAVLGARMGDTGDGLLVPRPVGPVIDLKVADVAFDSGTVIPTTGWQAAPPGGDIRAEARRRGMDLPTVWVRYGFEPLAFGGQPIAVFTNYIRERFTLYVNGTDLYRSNAAPGDQSFGWNRPTLVPVPAALLRPGQNQLVFRIDSVLSRPLLAGRISIGPDRAMAAVYNRQELRDITGPHMINGILGVLTLVAALCWLMRPQERIFGWLVAVGSLWFFRNLHYYIVAAPLDVTVFWNLTTDSIFAVMAVAYGFAAEFFDLPHKRRFTLAVVAACALGVASRYGLVLTGHSEFPSFLVLIPVALATLYVLGRACWQSPRLENFLMFVAVAAATGFGFHDLAAVSSRWAGASFYLQPYGGLMVFAAFGLALGRRMLVALATNEDVNQTLERRVERATFLLNESEATRRELQVASAVEIERERLMREIHDGAGSSLNPDGDVVMLLASLRHRMERELKAAGVSFAWKVQPTPALPWLDAVAALHVLRILQEAIGNILAHSRARLVEVHCLSSVVDGEDGVLVTIADDGRGFDLTLRPRGRGLANMRARAEALNARFTCDSTIGYGTRLLLWLPMVQVRAAA